MAGAALLVAVGVSVASVAPAGTVAKSHTLSPATTRIAGVGLRTVLYVDHSRTTYNYATGATVGSRRLITEIRYPSSDPTTSEISNAPLRYAAKPYPVIIFAEGYRARPDLYAKLLDAWVRAGYVVVSPEFPDTTYPATDAAINAGYPHGSPEDDLTNEPGDIAFVISQLTHVSARPSNFLYRLVNVNEVILAGQSDGAALVDLYAYDTRYVVNRAPIRATAIFAGYDLSVDANDYREPPSGVIPALVAQSAGDTCNEPELSVTLYDRIGGEKFFLEVKNATHLGPFVGSNPLAFDAVRDMSLKFFSHVLTPTKSSTAAVIRSGTIVAEAIASATPTVAQIPTPPGSPYCAPAY